MDGIKVVSFDVEGTLVTPDYSYAVWFEAIPQRYAEKHNIDFTQAKAIVEEEYKKVGDQRLEWYDVWYWFKKLDLGIPISVMQECRNKVSYYPEVMDVLESLSNKYTLSVASGSPRDFLVHLLKDIESHFTNVFSSVSDYKRLKTPKFYRDMCRVLQVHPEQVVHVGDNWQFDVQHPAEIGIHTFYLDRKGQSNNKHSLTSLAQLKQQLLD